ncbi:MAG: DUF3551 domain-containing protein [Magnetococcales bacterium]|nr:DUF3551 domain-containing protein [Magnetococcales bacterium]
MKRIFMAVFALLLCSNEALAALYCVVDFSGRRCIYPDLISCKRAAGGSGSCELNREQLVAPSGGAPFCLVERWQTECNYQTLASCEQQAKPRKATCINNPNLSPSSYTPAQNPNNRWSTPQKNSTNQNNWQQSWPGQQQERRYLPHPGYDPSPGSR